MVFPIFFPLSAKSKAMAKDMLKCAKIGVKTELSLKHFAFWIEIGTLFNPFQATTPPNMGVKKA
jgi:hypothetical protein